MKRIAILPVLFFTLAAFSQKVVAPVQFSNPSSVATPKGYSHSAIVDLGSCKMVIISGQVALDKNGNLIGKFSIEKQTQQVFLNIKSIVEAAGGSMENVVRLGFFVTDLGQIQKIRRVRDSFVNTQKPPTSTLVQVSKLFRDDLLIEIEATAIIPSK